MSDCQSKFSDIERNRRLEIPEAADILPRIKSSSGNSIHHGSPTRYRKIKRTISPVIGACLVLVCGSHSPPVSLLDQFAPESKPTWRLTAWMPDQRSIRERIQSTQIDESRSVDTEEISFFISVDISPEDQTLLRLMFPRIAGKDHRVDTDIFLTNGDTIRYGQSMNGRVFDIRIPPQSSGISGMRFSFDSADAIPNRLVAFSGSNDVSHQELKRGWTTVRWAGREIDGNAVNIGSHEIFAVSFDGCTRWGFGLVNTDTMTLHMNDIPDNGDLAFWYVPLRVHPRKGPLIDLDVYRNKAWHTVASIAVRPEMEWISETIPRYLFRSADSIRFRGTGDDCIIAVCEPCIQRVNRHGKKNVIIIDLDTMRADRLMCYGYDERNTSARLDSFLQQWGFHIFRNAHSSSPWTLPATAKFFSSRYRNFEIPTGVPREYTMLAEILRENGYLCTGITGGAHLRSPGLEQGFHSYFWSKDWGKVEDCFPQALKWLNEEAREPFFLFLHTYEPHTPYTRDIFCSDLSSGRLGNLSKGEELIGQGVYVCTSLTYEESLYVQAAYDGGIRFSCDAVAGLLSHLDDLHLKERTVVIILSDHGEEFWEHFPIFAEHGHSLYSELLHVPFMLFDPEYNRGDMNHIFDQVSTVDLVPTLIDLLDFAVADTMDGVSLVPLIEGKNITRRIPIMAQLRADTEIPLSRFCLFQDDMKFISSIGPSRTVKKLLPCRRYPAARELYNVKTDPDECDNLLGKSDETGEWWYRYLLESIDNALSPTVTYDYAPRELPEDLEKQLRMLGYLEN